MRILVGFAFMDTLSSPPATVQFRKAVRFQKNVLTPSVFWAGAYHKYNVQFNTHGTHQGYQTYRTRGCRIYVNTIQEYILKFLDGHCPESRLNETNSIEQRRRRVDNHQANGSPGKLETPWVKSYLQQL
jgi:hypothetical protein